MAYVDFVALFSVASGMVALYACVQANRERRKRYDLAQQLHKEKMKTLERQMDVMYSRYGEASGDD